MLPQPPSRSRAGNRPGPRAVHGRESGFTLIELVIVMLVIGLLAAIALSTFLAQTRRAHDADAKSNVRNLATIVEACRAGERDYLDCDTLPELDHGGREPLGLAWGAVAGEVEVDSAAATTYELVGRSRSGNEFRIRREASGALVHDCTTRSRAGCPAGGDW